MPSENLPSDSANTSFQPTAHMLRWIALLVLAALVSVAFLDMVRPFLSALLLAAILAALLDPAYQFLLGKLGGRKGLASGLTLVATLIAIIAPTVWVALLAAEQAAGLADSATALYQELATDAKSETLPDWMPFQDTILQYWPQISAKVGQLASSAASFLVASLSSLTRGTANFFMGLFIFLYGLFFFLQMEPSIIREVLSYTGLKRSLQETLEDRIVSVSRATIKGTLLIGVAQGALGAIGFWATGISGAAFWGVVMVIFSVIPGIGATFIIFCGAVFLFVEGNPSYAIGLALWGALVVGTIDNILRPVLVGRDAEMHDIVILISTLGGLASFGAVGLVLGPVLAGIFLTIWKTLSEATTEETEAGPEGKDQETPTPAPTEAGKSDAGAWSISKDGLDDEVAKLRAELEDVRRSE
ncbi:AI-2E family transporter [Tropicimonas sp. TH_r6]|uniref:AI-2E family transporter n=1 Tax=Tropicimonas sp. TH_r6 TaxID=3082085 RepID=UPI002952FD02|nr:AI-2E family transporter [Tropicimonas sp. TH_r6]MDV7143852.1 AI-2E family transporter [Tropicimonas sp. TH_r6]